MAALVSFLVFCQALGASVGTFTVIWAELAYMRAHKDGRISSAERDHLRIIGHGLYFGMLLLLLSSLGLVIAAYAAAGEPQPAVSAQYWTFITLALLIILVSSMLPRRRISYALGSAILFTAWWLLAYLAFGWLPPLTFAASTAFFIVSSAILYMILTFSRVLYLGRR